MSDLSRVEKPGQEAARVYPGDGLDTAIRPGGSNEPKVYPSGQEKAITVKPGTGNDAR